MLGFRAGRVSAVFVRRHSPDAMQGSGRLSKPGKRDRAQHNDANRPEAGRTQGRRVRFPQGHAGPDPFPEAAPREAFRDILSASFVPPFLHCSAK